MDRLFKMFGGGAATPSSSGGEATRAGKSTSGGGGGGGGGGRSPKHATHSTSPPLHSGAGAAPGASGTGTAATTHAKRISYEAVFPVVRWGEGRRPAELYVSEKHSKLSKGAPKAGPGRDTGMVSRVVAATHQRVHSRSGTESVAQGDAIVAVQRVSVRRIAAADVLALLLGADHREIVLTMEDGKVAQREQTEAWRDAPLDVDAAAAVRFSELSRAVAACTVFVDTYGAGTGGGGIVPHKGLVRVQDHSSRSLGSVHSAGSGSASAAGEHRFATVTTATRVLTSGVLNRRDGERHGALPIGMLAAEAGERPGSVQQYMPHSRPMITALGNLLLAGEPMQLETFLDALLPRGVAAAFNLLQHVLADSMAGLQDQRSAGMRLLQRTGDMLGGGGGMGRGKGHKRTRSRVRSFKHLPRRARFFVEPLSDRQMQVVHSVAAFCVRLLRSSGGIEQLVGPCETHPRLLDGIYDTRGARGDFVVGPRRAAAVVEGATSGDAMVSASASEALTVGHLAESIGPSLLGTAEPAVFAVLLGEYLAGGLDPPLSVHFHVLRGFLHVARAAVESARASAVAQTRFHRERRGSEASRARGASAGGGDGAGDGAAPAATHAAGTAAAAAAADDDDDDDDDDSWVGMFTRPPARVPREVDVQALTAAATAAADAALADAAEERPRRPAADITAEGSAQWHCGSKLAAQADEADACLRAVVVAIEALPAPPRLDVLSHAIVSELSYEPLLPASLLSVLCAISKIEDLPTRLRTLGSVVGSLPVRRRELLGQLCVLAHLSCTDAHMLAYKLAPLLVRVPNVAVAAGMELYMAQAKAAVDVVELLVEHCRVVFPQVDIDVGANVGTGDDGGGNRERTGADAGAGPSDGDGHSLSIAQIDMTTQARSDDVRAAARVSFISLHNLVRPEGAAEAESRPRAPRDATGPHGAFAGARQGASAVASVGADTRVAAAAVGHGAGDEAISSEDVDAAAGAHGGISTSAPLHGAAEGAFSDSESDGYGSSASAAAADDVDDEGRDKHASLATRDESPQGATPERPTAIPKSRLQTIKTQEVTTAAAPTGISSPMALAHISAPHADVSLRVHVVAPGAPPVRLDAYINELEVARAAEAAATAAVHALKRSTADRGGSSSRDGIGSSGGNAGREMNGGVLPGGGSSAAATHGRMIGGGRVAGGAGPGDRQRSLTVAVVSGLPSADGDSAESDDGASVDPTSSHWASLDSARRTSSARYSPVTLTPEEGGRVHRLSSFGRSLATKAAGAIASPRDGPSTTPTPPAAVESTPTSGGAAATRGQPPPVPIRAVVARGESQRRQSTLAAAASVGAVAGSDALKARSGRGLGRGRNRNAAAAAGGRSSVTAAGRRVMAQALADTPAGRQAKAKDAKS